MLKFQNGSYQILILLLLSFLATKADPQVIVYINNNATGNDADGSVTKPYANYSQAYSEFLQTKLDDKPVTIVFVNTGKPYEINSDGSFQNVSVHFTSDVTYDGDCSTLPVVWINNIADDQARVSFKTTQSSIFEFSNINLLVDAGSASNKFECVMIMSDSKLNVSLQNMCIRANTGPVAYSPRILSIKCTQTDKKFIMNNIKIFTSMVNIDPPVIVYLQTGNTDSDSPIQLSSIDVYIEAALPQKGQVVAKGAFFQIFSKAQRGNLLLKDIEIHQNFPSVLDLSEVEIFRLSNFDSIVVDNLIVKDAFLMGYYHSLINFEDNLNITISNVNISNIIAVGGSAGTDPRADLIVFKLQGSEDGLDLDRHSSVTLQNINVQDSQNVQVLNLQIPLSSLSISNVNILNVTQPVISLFQIMPILTSHDQAMPKVKRFLIDNVNIQKSKISSLLNFLPLNSELNPYINLIPPFQVNLTNLKATQNEFSSNNQSYAGLITFICSTVVVQNSFFSQNNWIEIRGFSDQYLTPSVLYQNIPSNWFFINTSFVNEGTATSALIYTTSMSPFTSDSNSESLIYRFLYIQDCTFRDLHDASSLSSHLIYTESPFLIMTENIYQHITISSSSSLMMYQGLLSKFWQFTKRNLTLEKAIFAELDIPIIHLLNQTLIDISYFAIIAHNIYRDINMFGYPFNSIITAISSVDSYLNRIVIEKNVFSNIDAEGTDLFGFNSQFAGFILNQNILIDSSFWSILKVQNSVEVENVTISNNIISGVSMYSGFSIKGDNIAQQAYIKGNTVLHSELKDTLFDVTGVYNYWISLDSNVISSVVTITVDYFDAEIISIQPQFQDLPIRVTVNRTILYGLYTKYTVLYDGYNRYSNSFIHIEGNGDTDINIESLIIKSCYIDAPGATVMKALARSITIDSLSYFGYNEIGLYATSYFAFTTKTLSMTNTFFNNYFLDNRQSHPFMSFTGINNMPNIETSLIISNMTSDLVFEQKSPGTNSRAFLEITTDTLSFTASDLNITNAGFNVFEVIASRSFVLKFDNIAYQTLYGYLLLTSKEINSCSISVTNYNDLLVKTPPYTLSTLFGLNACKMLTMNLTNMTIMQSALLTTSSKNVQIYGEQLNFKTQNPTLSSSLIGIQTSGSVELSFNSVNFWSPLPPTTIFKLDSDITSFLMITSVDDTSAWNNKHNINLQNAKFTNYPINIISGSIQGVSLTVNLSNLEFDAYMGSIILSRDIPHRLYFQNITAKQSLFKLGEIAPSAILELKNITLQDFAGKQDYIGQFHNTDATFENVFVSNISGNIQLKFSKISLKNFTCTKNSVDGHGGCLYLRDSRIEMTNSSFINNSAAIGGAIYTEEMEKISQEGAVFENSAAKYGHNIGSEAVNFNVLVTQNLDEVSNYEPKYFEFTLNNYRLENGTRVWQYRNASIAMLNISTFHIIMYDNYNQTVVYTMSSPPSINSSRLHAFTYENGNNIVLAGTDIKLNHKQNVTQLLLTLKYQNIYETFILEFVTRDCLPGEFKNNLTDYCEVCTPGFYSLDPSNPCAQCPTNAFCPGGAILNVNPRYWRAENSSILFACIGDSGILARCKGGNDTASQCNTQFSGALCQGCNYEAGYVPNGNNCAKCSSNGFSLWLNAVGSILLAYGWELFSLYSSIVSIKNFVRVFIKDDVDYHTKMRFKRKYYMGIQINFLTSFIQIMSIIFVYAKYSSVQINEFVTQVVTNLLSYISSPSARQSSSLDCLFLHLGVAPNEIIFFKIKYWIILPIVKLALTLILVSIISKLHKIEDFRGTITGVLFYLILYEQPGLLLNLGRFSACFLHEINDVGFAQIDPKVSCGSADYLNIKNNWALPAIFVWGIAISVTFFILLVMTRKTFNTVGTRKIFGALINSYKQSAFYWTIALMGLKLGIILSLSLIDEHTTAFHTCFIVILAYYLLLKYVEPYSGQEFMKMEQLSVITYMVTMFILAYSAHDKYPSLLIFGSIIIVSMNLYTILYIC